ncbi:MAG: chemotaxis-specific protein-glutamate methyltransferase CheB [Campylobacterales bacterium]|nr:chemotaxis-specific protein-glutamate methyltransferase CheB [Campylobacterales bacterium]
MIRVIIAEDSVTVREMLVYLFASEADIEIVGVANDGEEAVDMVSKLKPDIILMDINMPRLNGYEAAQKIMQENPVPILLMSASWDMNEVEKIVKSMHLGVLGVHEKPYGSGHPRFKELYNKILLDLRLMSDVKVVRRWNHEDKYSKSDFKSLQKRESVEPCSFIVIGSSTGGPPVLHTILKALPHDYPLPILVAQHMSSEFIESFIEWLNGACVLNVKKAQEGEKISGGNVYIAPSKYHLALKKDKIKLIESKENELIVPSVSKLFGSAIKEHPAEVVAILLSGMGNDGAEEMKKLRDAGAITIGQNEETSVVFGMANEAIKKGGIEFILSPEGITELLLSMQITKKETV